MIDTINSMTNEAAKQDFHRCCASTQWIEQMANARPFTSVDQMHEVAVEIWNELTDRDYLEAFEGHPMIGADIEALRAKFTHTSAWSEGEQSGVQSASEDVLRRLQQANIEYLNRFGYIFIVCATGKTAAEMLALLEARLHNPPDLEMTIAAGEQQKITTIRLSKWLETLA